MRWDDYLEQGVMQAIDMALAISRADRVNTLGFCVGGTLLASALAVLAAKQQDKVASMTLLTTMLDFSDTGELGLLIDEQSAAAREAQIGQGGLLKGSELAQVFAALRANDLIWPYVVAGYLKGKAPAGLRPAVLERRRHQPAGADVLLVPAQHLPREQAARAGRDACSAACRWTWARSKVPAFLYASREDHIVPWQTAYTSTQLLGGDLTFVLGASGHIAGVINPPAKQQAQPLGRRRGRRCQGLAGARPQRTGQLVAGLERLAQRACGRAGCLRPRRRQPPVHRDRTRPGALCEGQGPVADRILFTHTLKENPMEDIVIVAAARTAVGKFGGTLAKTPATELGRHRHQGAAGSRQACKASRSARSSSARCCRPAPARTRRARPSSSPACRRRCRR